MNDKVIGAFGSETLTAQTDPQKPCRLRNILLDKPPLTFSYGADEPEIKCTPPIQIQKYAGNEQTCDSIRLIICFPQKVEYTKFTLQLLFQIQTNNVYI